MLSEAKSPYAAPLDKLQKGVFFSLKGPSQILCGNGLPTLNEPVKMDVRMPKKKPTGTLPSRPSGRENVAPLFTKIIPHCSGPEESELLRYSMRDNDREESFLARVAQRRVGPNDEAKKAVVPELSVGWGETGKISSKSASRGPMSTPKSAESRDQERSTAIDSDRNNTNCTTTTQRLFFSTSLMADVILLESSVPFDAAEWIGVGREKEENRWDEAVKVRGQQDANQASEGRKCSTKTAEKGRAPSSKVVYSAWSKSGEKRSEFQGSARGPPGSLSGQLGDKKHSIIANIFGSTLPPDTFPVGGIVCFPAALAMAITQRAHLRSFRGSLDEPVSVRCFLEGRSVVKEEFSPP
ncbi:hypothetical protein B0H14DRAFT_2602836 [Mycena olivaceomarginata]|nr:hypothetical protein B0H14DRAFT_2602836 [Mycena olivaceomarginata]